MSIWNKITVSDIDSIFTVPSSKGRHFQMHNRKYYGLSFCSDEGQITYSMNGNTYVSNRTHAVLLPMGGNYLLQGDAEGEFPLINFFCTPNFCHAEFAVCRLHNPESYLRDYERMRTLWLLDKNRAKVFSIFYDMLARLAKENDESEAYNPLTSTMEYLNAHLDDPTLSNEILAEQASLSEVHFRRLFKEIYGTTPKQYVLELRIRYAKQLLAENTATVTSIAERCGFSGVYHFCRAFRTVTGQTPTEYGQNAEK